MQRKKKEADKQCEAKIRDQHMRERETETREPER